MLRYFLVALLALTAAAPAYAGQDDAVVGTWRNMRNTMHIQTYHCGPSICGKVVWASDEAVADAKRGGSGNPIGTEVFSNFQKDAGGNWRGRVFVPDLRKTFSGSLLIVDRNTLKGSGCLIGRVFCKSKVLVRI